MRTCGSRSDSGVPARGGGGRLGIRAPMGGRRRPAPHPRGRPPAPRLAGRRGPRPARGFAAGIAVIGSAHCPRDDAQDPGPLIPMTTGGPLVGLTVLDLSTIVSGGTVTSLLADLGAQVVKIEHPEGGDPLRSWGPFVSGVSVWWKVVSRNKKSITLNLSRPRGQQLLTELVGHAAAPVENFRPGTLERWAAAPAALLERNSPLVVLRIYGVGQSG